MLIAAPVSSSWREKIPAVTHIDGSARSQGVSSNSNALFHDAITGFHHATGLPFQYE
jgi:carbamoyltransferase